MQYHASTIRAAAQLVRNPIQDFVILFKKNSDVWLWSFVFELTPIENCGYISMYESITLFSTVPEFMPFSELTIHSQYLAWRDWLGPWLDKIDVNSSAVWVNVQLCVWNDLWTIFFLIAAGLQLLQLHHWCQSCCSWLSKFSFLTDVNARLSLGIPVFSLLLLLSNSVWVFYPSHVIFHAHL